jgi:hypothetical protein
VDRGIITCLPSSLLPDAMRLTKAEDYPRFNFANN